MMLSAMVDGRAAESKWIVDETTGCGTSNPFPAPDERIRWYGQCKDGRLKGEGTLIWYRGGVEVERNEGTFLNGELHGHAVTSYPDGQSITGEYLKGHRHGDFYVAQKDGSYIRAVYERDRLVSQSKMTQRDVNLWRQQRSRESLAVVAATPSPQVQAAPAPVPAPYPAYQQQAQPTSAPTPTPTYQQQLAAQPTPAPTPTPTYQAQYPTSPAQYPTYPAQYPTSPAQYPTYQAQYPTYQAQYPAYPVQAAVQPGYVQPAVMLNYADDVNAGQLFVNLFASSGNNAVAPAAMAPQVTYRAPVAAYAPYVPPPQYYAPQPANTYPVYGWQPQYAAPPAIGPLLPVTYVYPSGQPVQANIQSAYSPGSVTRAVVGTGAADTLFSQGYQLEQTGRFYEAEQIYQQVLLNHPSAPSAMLANARLTALQQDVRRSAVQIVNPPQPSIVNRAGSLVVAVNSPFPPPSQLPASMLPVYDHGIVQNSPVLYHNVCSRDGLYEDNAGWCGVVTRDESQHYLVEVRDIRLRAFGTIGITRSTCTGNTFLTWFSRGSTIRVPKPCVSVIQ